MELVKRWLPHVVGLVSVGVVVAGIWGRWGWEFAAMIGGGIPAGFYVWGQIRDAQSPKPGGYS